MAIVKKTKSGKAVLFIDEYGNSFITSVAYLRSLLNGTSKVPFILLNRLPDKVSSDRFKLSPVFDPATGETVEVDSLPSEDRQGLEGDALSRRVIKGKEKRSKLNKDVIL